MKLKAGDWVEVKSKEEILATLDKNGQLENLPFMPQMFQYCGKRFQVYKRAHKTCDTVNPVRSLRIHNTVHLETRCNGEAYGGCQAACLIFWKTAWLKPVREQRDINQVGYEGHVVARQENLCTETDVWRGICVQSENRDAEVRYVCQATQVPHIGHYLPWWDFRQYVEDYISGNVSAMRMLKGGLFATYASLIQAGIGLGPILSWIYDVVQTLLRGIPWPRRSGKIPAGESTPAKALNLQPGELVRVKPYKDILATLDTDARNRGLMWDREMVPFCGGEYRVKTRLARFVDEKSGKLIAMKTPAILLEDVWCGARYSDCRMYCPRSIYPWWREIWLERIPDHSGNAQSNEGVICKPGRERERVIT